MGPWSRSFLSAVVGRTERPAEAALADVADLSVEVGVIGAQVGGCTVTLAAEPVPPRIWAAMVRFARGRGPLEEAVAGRIQSVHLEHLMAEDWGEPLVPRARSIARACSCEDGVDCEHVVALAFAYADEVEVDPAVLLRWRGCFEQAAAREPGSVVQEVARRSEDPWRAGGLPQSGEVRVLPSGAVLKRLGPSEIRVGDRDLSEVLAPAYDELRD